MSDRNIFEIASRKKYRFSYKGEIGVEDLWDVSFEALDSIYADLRNQYKQVDNHESLIDNNDEKVATQIVALEDKIAIVKHIFDTRKAELEAAKNAQNDYKFNQKILEMIAKKEDTVLEGKSIDELKAMLR